MPTPTGEIGLNQVNTELGLSSTATITMNDTVVRTLAGVPGSGTTISMDNLRGKSAGGGGARVSIPLSIGGSFVDYNLYNNVGPTYSPGNSDITLTVGPSARVWNSGNPAALSIPVQFSPGDTVTLNIQTGAVIAGRGAGGAVFGQAGIAGSGGLLVQRPVTIFSNGIIAGGGGGGGSGAQQTFPAFIPRPPKQGGPFLGSCTLLGGGGGGGGGYVGGPGGYTAGSYGGGVGLSWPAGATGGLGGGPRSASDSNGITRNSGFGGNGGCRGSYGLPGTNACCNGVPIAAGGVGGGAGFSVSGNPFITWQAFGQRIGPVS